MSAAAEQPTGRSSPATTTLTAILGQAGLFVGLAAAWLFAAGWAYATAYYGAFGIGLVDLDIPEKFFLLYGGWVVAESWMWLTGVTLALVVVGVVRRLRMGGRHIPLGALCLAIFLTVVVTFVVGLWLGERTAWIHAAQDRALDWPAHPRIRVSTAWTESEGPGIRATDLESGCWRLLLATSSQLFLFRPYRGVPVATPAVLVLPRGGITAFGLLPDRPSCP